MILNTLSRGKNTLLTIASICVVLTLTASLFNTPYALTQAQSINLNIPYAYRIPALIPGNLSVSRLLMLNETAVLVIASGGGRDYVAVLDVANPYVEPEVLQLYPLVGRVTAFSTDGWPVTRISVGTDKGEVMLFKVGGGRIYRMLDVALGADFYVRETVVMRAAAGDFKVAALVSERGVEGGVCASCYVYVFSERVSGVLKIGSSVGNATASYQGILPQDIAPLTVFTGSTYYYDASRLIITWMRQDFITLVVNVTYPQDTELKPASEALVDVVAYNATSGLKYSYGFNTGADGTVGIPVLRGLMVNITVRDVNMRTYLLRYDTSKIPGYVSTISLPRIVLNAPPLTIPASAYYETPEFLLANLEVLDVSNAPYGYSKVGFVNFKVSPTDSGLTLLKGVDDTRYVITHYDSKRGFVNISRVDAALKRASLTTEYVGSNTGLSFSMTLRDGRLLVLALSDGRVKTYSLVPGAREYYRLEYTYVYGRSVSRVGLFMGGDTPAIFITSPSGLQVVRLTPYLTPILRRELTLNYAGGHSEGGYVDSDILSDFSAGVVCNDGRLTVMRNLDLLVGGSPVSVDSFTAGNAFIRVVPPGNESATYATVTFKYPGGSLTRVPDENGMVIFENILPGIKYEVTVKHSKPYVNPNTTYIELSDFGDVHLNIYLTYKEFVISLRVSDAISGDLIAPYNVVADGRFLISSSVSRDAEVKLLYGVHNITVAPASGYENVYESFERTLLLSSDQTLEVTLNRRVYLLEVRVEDAVTVKLIAPVEVVIDGVSQLIDVTAPKAYFILPYGNYNITVKPVPGYEAIYKTLLSNVSLTRASMRVLKVPRNTYSLYLSIRDVTVNILRGTFDVYVNNTRVAGDIAQNTTLTLPYGIYSLQVKPTSRYEVMYNPSQTITLKLTNNTSVNVPLTRRYYTLRVRVQEGETPIKNAEIKFINAETDMLIAILGTYEEGYVETKLFYGPMRIEVTYPGYYDEVRTVSLERDTEVIVYMSPQPVTLFFRYMPVVAVVIIAIIGIYGVLKLRTLIYQRLYKEESLF